MFGKKWAVQSYFASAWLKNNFYMAMQYQQIWWKIFLNLWLRELCTMEIRFILCFVIGQTVLPEYMLIKHRWAPRHYLTQYSSRWENAKIARSFYTAFLKIQSVVGQSMWPPLLGTHLALRDLVFSATCVAYGKV